MPKLTALWIDGVAYCPACETSVHSTHWQCDECGHWYRRSTSYAEDQAILRAEYLRRDLVDLKEAVTLGLVMSIIPVILLVWLFQ